MVIKNNDLTKILPQRYPFLMIDRIIEYVPGEKIVCIKNVTANEAHFMGHFPDYAVVPGVLIIESAAQAGIVFFHYHNNSRLTGQREYLLSSVKASFMKSVIPGDQLILTVKPVKILAEAGIMKVECTVSDDMVAKCEFTVSAKLKTEEKSGMI